MYKIKNLQKQIYRFLKDAYAAEKYFYFLFENTGHSKGLIALFSMKISCIIFSLVLFVSTTQHLKDNSLSIKRENINQITLYFVKKIMIAMKRWNGSRFSIAKFNLYNYIKQHNDNYYRYVIVKSTYVTKGMRLCQIFIAMSLLKK